MASTWKDYDGAIVGGTLGLIVAYPVISSTINSFITGIIPTTWNWLGSSTTPILVIAAGLLIGLIVDKT